MVDIFTVGTSMNLPFWHPKNIGDKIQGTYVDHTVGQDSYGNEQHLYVLKLEDNSMIRVPFKSSKKFMIEAMERVKFGQIIGFVYTKNLPPKRPGQTQDTKAIDLVQNPAIVDTAWIESQKVLASVNQTPANAPVFTPVQGVSSAPQAIPTDPKELFPAPHDAGIKSLANMDSTEKIAYIADIAKTKFNIQDPSQVKDVVVQNTGLPFAVSNLDAIIEKLNSI